jgi:predicted kinase
MNYVIVMVGLPGSGKSYLIDKLVSEGKDTWFTYSTDAYIEAQAELLGSTYTEVFEHCISEATDYMNSALQIAIAEGYNVLWDQTNMNTKKRRWITSQFPASYYKQCFVLSPPRNNTEWDVLYARLGARVNKSIPGYVLDSMLATYTEPTLDEGFSHIHIHSIRGGLVKSIPEATIAK